MGMNIYQKEKLVGSIKGYRHLVGYEPVPHGFKVKCSTNRQEKKTDRKGSEMWTRNLSLFKKWANPGLFFFIFVFPIKQLVDKLVDNLLPMSGFEPRISGAGSGRSTN